MFLSIIIPIYNAERFISECLESCIHQNISKTDYEIICVNDGSTDHSLQIIQKYASKYDNIKIINQKNGGEGAARNAGLRIARGDYCWFLDADDLMKEDCLSEIHNACIDRKAEVVVFKSYYFHQELSSDEKLAIKSGSIQSNQSFSGLWSRVIRRDIIGHTLFREGLPYGADIIFLREILLTLSTPDNLELDSVFHFYRLNDYSITHRKNNDLERAVGHCKAAIAMYEFYCAPSGRCEANANILMNHLWFCMMACAKLPRKQADEVINQLRDHGLFPMRRPLECTTHNAHVTPRKDLIGKLINFLFTHSHTIIGYLSLRLYYGLKR